MMKVEVRVYDDVKYSKDSKEIARVQYTIDSFTVFSKTNEEMVADGYDEFDEYEEYLQLNLADGDTATFRNSHVDMFRLH